MLRQGEVLNLLPWKFIHFGLRNSCTHGPGRTFRVQFGFGSQPVLLIGGLVQNRFHFVLVPQRQSARIRQRAFAFGLRTVLGFS